MKRFIDLRGQHTGNRFAWWDTCVDRFESFKGEWAFTEWKDFVEVYEGDEIDRYRGLCPKWVFIPENEQDDVALIRQILNKIKVVLDHNNSNISGFDGLFEAYEELEDRFGI